MSRGRLIGGSNRSLALDEGRPVGVRQEAARRWRRELMAYRRTWERACERTGRDGEFPMADELAQADELIAALDAAG